jgi:hypothetical protein
MEAQMRTVDGWDRGRVGRREGSSTSRIKILDTDTEAEAEADRDEDLPRGDSADPLGAMWMALGAGDGDGDGSDRGA